MIIMYASNIGGSGSISSNGNDSSSGGGVGAGGSILLKSQSFYYYVGTVNAHSGIGGSNGFYSGGSGGSGRIRVEYCDSPLTSSTSPAASTQKLNCYIGEQVESSPYNVGRLNLPENVNGTEDYKIQYGRKIVFAGAGDQMTYLRVPAGPIGKASLDALVSGLSSSTLFLFDVGDDGLIEWSGTVTNTSTNTNNSLAAAFSKYWSTHGSPVTGTIDVPIRVWLGSGGQVLLTNLLMSQRYTYIPFVDHFLPQLATPTFIPITAPGINAQYTISWISVPDASTYQVQEASDSSFTTPTMVYSGTATSTQIPSRGITTYYYRVKASNGSIDSQWSNSQSVDVRWELEPNDYYTQSTQLLSSAQSVYGYPGDAKDFFSFYMPASGQITVDLTGHTGQGLQLLLFYQSTSDMKLYAYASPYHLSYTGQPGWYYVYIYSTGNYNSVSPYTLLVSYPTSLSTNRPIASP